MRKLCCIVCLPRRAASMSAFMLLGAIMFAQTFHAVLAQTVATKNAESSRGESAQARMVGAWRLVSRQSRLPNGELIVDPGLAATPMGVLIYDQSGHVAAQLSRR